MERSKVARSKMAEIAASRNQTESDMLRDLFREHITVSEVARALGVKPPTIDMALLRNGLQPKWSCELVPRKFDWENQSENK